MRCQRCLRNAWGCIFREVPTKGICHPAPNDAVKTELINEAGDNRNLCGQSRRFGGAEFTGWSHGCLPCRLRPGPRIPQASSGVRTRQRGTGVGTRSTVKWAERLGGSHWVGEGTRQAQGSGRAPSGSGISAGTRTDSSEPWRATVLGLEGTFHRRGI